MSASARPTAATGAAARGTLRAIIALGTLDRAVVVGLRRRLGQRDAVRLDHRQLPLEKLLDITQISAFLAVAEADRHAAGARAGGSADAVHVRLGLVRQVVVHDV